jgi:hypothetical protein
VTKADREEVASRVKAVGMGPEADAEIPGSYSLVTLFGEVCHTPEWRRDQQVLEPLGVMLLAIEPLGRAPQPR